VVNVNPSTAYYSYNLGSWHIIALNTAPCALGTTSFCAAGSAQDVWLQNDLAHDTAPCTLAYYQNPHWTSDGTGGHTDYQQIWQDLYQGGVDVVLNGDSHWYERFAPLNASGAIDNTFGVREFIAGTGGAGLEVPGTKLATSQVLNASTHGVMKMTLHNGSYSWQFINDGESTFTDSGSANCHSKP
jgi:acid phosphatase type 7